MWYFCLNLKKEVIKSSTLGIEKRWNELLFPKTVKNRQILNFLENSKKFWPLKFKFLNVVAIFYFKMPSLKMRFCNLFKNCVYKFHISYFCEFSREDLLFALLIKYLTPLKCMILLWYSNSQTCRQVVSWKFIFILSKFNQNMFIDANLNHRCLFPLRLVVFHWTAQMYRVLNLTSILYFIYFA